MWLLHAISNILFLCEKFLNEFIIFTCHPLIFGFLYFHLSMGKNNLKQAVTKHSQNLRGMFKRKKTKYNSNFESRCRSFNKRYRSVDSSVLTTLTREVNINTTTLQAAVSIPTLDVFTTLDVLPSVPELGNTAKTEDSVSTIETAISTTLDVSHSVPEEGKQATDNKKPAPVGQPFQPIDPKFDSRLRSFSNGKK